YSSLPCVRCWRRIPKPKVGGSSPLGTAKISPPPAVRAARKPGEQTRPDLRMRGLAMSDTTESDDERPCLHCLIGDVIDEVYAEYGSVSGEKDTIDVDEIMTAPSQTVAEQT